MTSLNVRKCAEYSVWCGKGPIPRTILNNKKYYRRGTPQECLKVGFGAGSYNEQRKNTPATSLRQIRYVGEQYERNFTRKGIRTTTTLIRKMKAMDAGEKKEFLRAVFKKKGGGLDKRAYNNTILYLHSKGIGNLPSCSAENKL